MPLLGWVGCRRLIPAMTLIAVVVGGCTVRSGPAEMSSQMRFSLLLDVGATAGFDQVPDWRRLDRPTTRLREYFHGQRATYRVIDAEFDAAELAVWQTGAPEPEPFNANRIATGAGCLVLQRHSDSVSSKVIDCPSPLALRQPDSSDASWGRESEAMRRAAVLIEGSIDQEVRWLMTKGVDGRPRTTPRTLEQVVAAVHQAVPPEGDGFVLAEVRQHGGTVTGLVTAHASGPDPVDTRRTVEARACGEMKVDLEDLHPNYLLAAAPCGAP